MNLIQQLIENYRKHGFTPDEAKTFLEFTKDADNERLIKEHLYDELISFKTNKIDVDRINFHSIFVKIRKSITGSNFSNELAV